jgi:hypothetical protein
MSSLSFLGDATSYLNIPNRDDFDFGTGDFTIEWYQYQTDTNLFPRIFQVGKHPNISIGVSIEGGTFYYWTNNSYNSVTMLDTSSYINQWVHFAICRANRVTKVYMNGTAIMNENNVFSMDDTTNFNGVADLTIGNESIPSTDAAFGGYITYFSWVKGVALYTANFTVSTNYPTFTNNSVLLLTAPVFSGTLGSTVVNNNVSTTPNVPPDFLSTPIPPPAPPLPQPVQPSSKPLFTNNSMVFYKAGSLASGGVGGVRNSSAKARRT